MTDLEERLEGFISDLRALRRQVAQLERKNLRDGGPRGCSDMVREAKGVKVLAATERRQGSVEALREMGDWLKAKMESGVLVLAMAQNGRPLLVSMVTPDLVARVVFMRGTSLRRRRRSWEGAGEAGPNQRRRVAGGWTCCRKRLPTLWVWWSVR